MLMSAKNFKCLLQANEKSFWHAVFFVRSSFIRAFCYFIIKNSWSSPLSRFFPEPISTSQYPPKCTKIHWYLPKSINSHQYQPSTNLLPISANFHQYPHIHTNLPTYAKIHQNQSISTLQKMGGGEVVGGGTFPCMHLLLKYLDSLFHYMGKKVHV